MSRKDRARVVRDLGGAFELEQGDIASEQNRVAGTDRIQQKTSLVMIDRVVLRVLKSTVEQLAADPDECRRFFEHYFLASMTITELNTWIADFLANPPRVQMGYPREDAEFPVISIILESSNGATSFVGDYGGETLGDEPGEESEYVSEFTRVSVGAYVYAQHPDVCSYLYHFTEMVLLGAVEAFSTVGVMDRQFSGGELSPQDAYLPTTDMFLRVCRFEATSNRSVPILKPYEKANRLRLGGIFACDVVVDGIRGGVHPRTDETD